MICAHCTSKYELFMHRKHYLKHNGVGVVKVMIKANCYCGRYVYLKTYTFVKHDELLLYRLYSGICYCGQHIEKEDWNEVDQIYLDCPELMGYLKP